MFQMNLNTVHRNGLFTTTKMEVTSKFDKPFSAPFNTNFFTSSFSTSSLVKEVWRTIWSDSGHFDFSGEEEERLANPIGRKKGWRMSDQKDRRRKNLAPYSLLVLMSRLKLVVSICSVVLELYNFSLRFESLKILVSSLSSVCCSQGHLSVLDLHVNSVNILISCFNFECCDLGRWDSCNCGWSTFCSSSKWPVEVEHIPLLTMLITVQQQARGTDRSIALKAFLLGNSIRLNTIMAFF